MNERLRMVRKALGLNQKTLAKELGVAQATFCQFETGVRVFQTRYIEMLKIKYGVNPDWMKTGEGDMFLPCDDTDEFVKMYMELSEDNKELVSTFINKLLQSQK